MLLCTPIKKRIRFIPSNLSNVESLGFYFSIRVTFDKAANVRQEISETSKR